MKTLWEKWKVFALKFGTFMSRVILSLIYFSIVLPYGFGVKWFSDPLAIKSRPEKSGWSPYPKVENGKEKFEQQY